MEQRIAILGVGDLNEAGLILSVESGFEILSPELVFLIHQVETCDFDIWVISVSFCCCEDAYESV